MPMALAKGRFERLRDLPVPGTLEATVAGPLQELEAPRNQDAGRLRAAVNGHASIGSASSQTPWQEHQQPFIGVKGNAAWVL